MFYYLYEIKNLINDKVYVGVHKTKSMDDGYMGSGKVILSAIKKHGMENFTKTILETFDNSEDMFAREKEVVTDEFLARPDTYNLRRGGFGGFDYINSNAEIITLRSGKVSDTMKRQYVEGTRSTSLTRLNSDPDFIKRRNEASTNRIRNTEKSPHFGKKWITNGKENLLVSNTEVPRDEWYSGRVLKKFNSGSKNPNYGSMWITNGKENRMIKKSETILEGWIRGRICLSSSNGRAAD